MDHLEASASSMLPPPQRDETVRYSKEEWGHHRPFIEGMYPLRGITLKSIVDALKEDRGFVVNERQLKRKIKNWKLEKNVKGDEMKFIARKIHQRAAIGKNTTVRVRGQPVDPSKIERWQKRCGGMQLNDSPASGALSPAASTPSDISYNTIQGLRSPSPYQQNSMLLGGSGSVLDGNPLQSSISTPPSLGHIGSSSRFDPGIPINHEHEEVFEGQSPAPFTAPPSPAPTPRTRFAASHELESISQSRVMDENIASTSQNVAVAISQLNQSTQKKRHRQTEELELSQRLKELRSRHGLDHPATVDTAVRLAKILSYQGRYRSAELLLKQCMDCVTKTLGENNPKTLLISGELAECFIRQDNLSKAEKLLRTIFSKEYQVFHPSDQRFLSLKVLFANCIASLGDFTAARRVLHEVMAVGAAAPLADKGVLNECTIQLAHVLQRQGDLYKAEKLLLELVETDASDWVSVAHKLLTRRCLGETYVLQGKPRKAEQIFREVHKAQKESHGPEHDFTLYTEGCLASALNDLGKFVEGEELVRETIRKCTKVLGMKHNLTLESGAILASLLNNQQRFIEAEEVATKVLTICEDVYGKKILTTCRSAMALGFSYEGQHRLEEAYSAIEKSFDGCAQILGPDHVQTKSFETKLIELTQKIDQLRKSRNIAFPRTNSPHHTPSGFSGLGDPHLVPFGHNSTSWP